MNTKKIVIILVLAVLIAAGAFYLLKTTRENNVRETALEASLVQKTDVDFSKAPEKFPSDVPIESGARLTQNYNATTPDGKLQATRSFETTQSLDANLVKYTDFLKSNGWDIQATTNDPTYKMVYGVKGVDSLLISIDENKVNKIKTVSISYTESN